MRGPFPFLAPVFVICAVCALAGCTTVSAPPTRPPAPPPSAPGRPERPDDVRVVPAPAHRVLATARPDTPSPDPRHHRAPAAPAPAPPHPAPRRAAPRTHHSGRLPRPAAPDMCGLGETYGGWAPGGQASSICREVYRP
ncbi:hypothetical protein OG896_03205 [Streptomyces sp. NBC_00669]|uniref:hypothetical protein n=1 Tax=Streptomyces sp. NBC_00669 TaxID=2976011 RepID=UPI002E34E359|nr:hypothetical protein [Streptomyces sp. NBC_00669]